MRTADDVISRILWDTPAEAEHFVVGYVDRFLGMLERPFSEFNWDTDPCDCDYTSELALPRHRIQYFVFRGQRVWDRNSRTDRVFGSTGQSLAPPFGEEEEAGGKACVYEAQGPTATHVRTSMHTHMRAHTHAYTRIHTHAYAHARTHTHTHTHTHKYTCKYTHANTHMQTHAHTDTHGHGHTQTSTDTRTQIQVAFECSYAKMMFE